MNKIGKRRVVGGMMGLHALTPVHPGCGSALGTVDLPISRERHTNWPNAAGSSQKGVLRDAMRESVRGDDTSDGARAKADRDPLIVNLFGRNEKVSEGDNENAGAISVTDARTLLFPVRSLEGTFAWLTCPAAIARLSREMKLTGSPPIDFACPEVPRFSALVPQGSPLIVGDEFVQLDDDTYSVVGQPPAIAEWICENLLPAGDDYAATRKRLLTHTIVVSDSDFTYFTQFATEICTRIGLDYDTKTVKTGALFNQEFIPTETLLYSIVLINEARSKNVGSGSSAKLQEMKSQFQSAIDEIGVLQIGGDETIGKGFCSVRLNLEMGGEA